MIRPLALIVTLAMASTFALAAPGTDAKPSKADIDETEFAGGDGGGVFRVFGIGVRVPSDTRITKLTFVHRQFIDSMVCHVQLRGKVFESARFGSGNSLKDDSVITEITMQPGEKITAVDVLTKNLNVKVVVVAAIIVQTTKQSVLIGDKDSAVFKKTLRPAKGTRVIGICGRSGQLVDSIGLQTIPDSNPESK